MLTERDKEIIRLINRFGYLTATQVARLMGMSQRVTYRRLRKLAEERYLIHNRVLAGRAGIYRATTRGLMATDIELSRAVVRLLTLEHNLAVADAAAALLERHPGAAWLTERELRRRAGQKFGVGWQGHIPDGVLVLGNRRFAVEVEMTAKEKRRVEKILRVYLRRSDYSEVWYFCRTKRQTERLKEVVKRHDFARVFTLGEVVQDGATDREAPVAAVLHSGTTGGSAAPRDADGTCGL